MLVRRLGLRLPEAATAPPVGDLLDLAALERWELSDRLLRVRLTGGDEAALRARCQAAGELPPDRYGDALWDALDAEVGRVDDGPWTPWSAAVAWQGRGADGAQHRIAGELPASWYRRADGTLAYATASAAKPQHVLGLRLGLALLAATAPGAAVRVRFRDQATELVVPTPASAAAELGICAALHALAARTPLPWWPAVQAPLAEGDAAAAWAAWSEPADGAPAVMQQPATRWCFRGCPDPFALPGPAVPWLPDAGAPLAVRIARLLRPLMELPA